MRIDVRLPIGALFTLLGILLAGFGATGNSAIYQRSLGININLWWGVVLLVFGVIMLALARRGSSALRSPAGAPTDRLQSVEKGKQDDGGTH
jgi:hypothetical protein